MSHAAAYALALLAALLFGAAAPAGKPLLASLHPVQLAGLLYLGAALGVAPVLIARRRLRPVWRADRPTRLRLGGAILAGGVVGPVLLLLGLDRAGAASVSLWLTATAALAPLDAGADAVLGALALGALAYGASI
ncbi:MAG: EamA family transporter, partial [Myxococcales bacterium]|nr:EamA family transporter [Myxococcales bacterium]